MHCKKCGEKVLKLLIMCLMTIHLTAFSCASVYAEETVEKDDNENIQESEVGVAGVYAYLDICKDACKAGAEFPSDDELMEWMVATLRYCIEESLKSVSYDEPQTATVRISFVDDEWVPDSDDVMNLEEVFFDMDDAMLELD